MKNSHCNKKRSNPRYFRLDRTEVRTSTSEANMKKFTQIAT